MDDTAKRVIRALSMEPSIMSETELRTAVLDLRKALSKKDEELTVINEKLREIKVHSNRLAGVVRDISTDTWGS